MVQISKGDQAPDFNLPTDDGGQFTLSANNNKLIVLFFYPKDDTSGCTKEAIEFTEKLSEFEKLGALVVGLSPDPVKKHDKFKAKHDLKMMLVSDEEKEALQAYGIWVEKSMYGRKYMGVVRTTLLIDKSGTVVEAWHKVKVPGHVDAVLEAIKTFKLCGEAIHCVNLPVWLAALLRRWKHPHSATKSCLPKPWPKPGFLVSYL